MTLTKQSFVVGQKEDHVVENVSLGLASIATKALPDKIGHKKYTHRLSYDKSLNLKDVCCGFL